MLEQQAELTPLALMLRIMRRRTRMVMMRGALAAAIAAASYRHSRLTSADVNVIAQCPERRGGWVLRSRRCWQSWRRSTEAYRRSLRYLWWHPMPPTTEAQPQVLGD